MNNCTCQFSHLSSGGICPVHGSGSANAHISPQPFIMGGFIPKGWQCPVCKAVMGPTIPSCVNCKGDKV